MTTRTALIIDGTSGVGLAAARQLLARGVTVHVAGRGRERLDALTATDPDLFGHQVDATDGDAVRALAAAVAPIDHLIITLSGSGG